MTITAGWLVGALLAIPAEEPRLLEERWETADVDGARVGHMHTTVHDLGDGRRRTTEALELSLSRNRAAVTLRVESGADEAADGKVVGVFMRQYQDRALRLSLSGGLDGDALRVQIDGGRLERRLRWPDGVVGPAGRERLFHDRRPAPGDRFTFVSYEPIVNSLVTLRAAARGPEEVSLPTGKKALLRLDVVPDRIEASNGSVQLPPSVYWLDEGFAVPRRQIEMEGLGQVVLTRTTLEAALAPTTGAARAADVTLKALVPLNRTIARPQAARSAMYRITLKGDPDAAGAFVSDAHQEARNAHGDTFELHVHPPRPGQGTGGEKPGPEYLASCPYIPCDDALVKELARRATGGEVDAWRKAKRIESWVRANMKVDNAAPLADAARTARDLRGDCRHYALLTAALCRAEGLPARTALGLVYVERERRPYLGFHMWAEVCVEGRWLGLDACLGPVGVGHVKVSDHSWHDTHSLTPLLPLQRVLGKASVEVLQVEE
jgi:hypothetical protein